MGALVLWDIDHTLVENSGVSKQIYAATFHDLAGFPPRHPVRTEGRTDRLIMRDMFEQHGVPVPYWSAVLSALATAGARHAGEMRRCGYLLVGVKEALHALARVPHLVQSVLTGNVEANAWMKLSALEIEDSVDLWVGAYGGDADDRAALVGIAQRRASRAYSQYFGPNNTVLIGDTPRDIDAGARGGAHVIAVASGVDSVDDLSRAGGTIVLPDLSNTARLITEIARLTA